MAGSSHCVAQAQATIRGRALSSSSRTLRDFADSYLLSHEPFFSATTLPFHPFHFSSRPPALDLSSRYSFGHELPTPPPVFCLDGRCSCQHRIRLPRHRGNDHTQHAESRNKQ